MCLECIPQSLRECHWRYKTEHEELLILQVLSLVAQRVSFQQMHPREADALRLSLSSLVQWLWTVMPLKTFDWPILEIQFEEAVHEHS